MRIALLAAASVLTLAACSTTPSSSSSPSSQSAVVPTTSTAKQAVAVLESRVLAAEKTGKEISAGLRALGDGINKIDVVQVADLGSRLNAINASLSGLASRIR